MNKDRKPHSRYASALPFFRYWVQQWTALVFNFFIIFFSQYASSESITIDAKQDSVEINGLSKSQLRLIAQLTQYELRSVISVYISEDYKEENSISLAVSGDVEFSQEDLKFIPQTPFLEKQTYLVIFSLLPIDEILLIEEFFTTESKTSPTDTVTNHSPIESIYHAAKLLKESLREKTIDGLLK